jgi:spore coat protein A, manganese oxidase
VAVKTRATWCAGVSLVLLAGSIQAAFAEALPGGTLDPNAIEKYAAPLVVPPAMPRTAKLSRSRGRSVDYYEIAVRQFRQQVLPPGLPQTTVWSYGSVNHPASFHYPAFTIEAKYATPVRVRWINDLKDPVTGAFLPHLLPVDPTLHWANPGGGIAGRDTRPEFTSPAGPYAGPVPVAVHLHGGHSEEWADGHPESWFLPDASDLPAGFAAEGSKYAQFRAAAERRLDCPGDPLACWGPGAAVFQYDNVQAAGTLWYHDHSLGMTRTNVYAGPAGFYLLRGGPSDRVKGVLPAPAPTLDHRPGTMQYDIPIVIQDRSFDADGSLFYPGSRAFFDGYAGPYLPMAAPGDSEPAPSDVSPIWNPEFFGNVMVVNGRTWPFLEVEARRYRFRFLNGSDSRFLILATGAPSEPDRVPFWQIGAEGGFLPAPVRLDTLLLGPAERADVVMDFTDVPAGTAITLRNLAPDEPFGGGTPGSDFEPSDPDTTGQVMQFRVVKRRGGDPSTPPDRLVLPSRRPLPEATFVRQVSLNELDSASVCVAEDSEPPAPIPCGAEAAEPFGPREALLGTVELRDGIPAGIPLPWADAITENPALDATEVWEIYNFTQDAHPIHIHEVMFETVNREVFDPEAPNAGEVRGPERGETGLKDTIVAYPGEITRVKATYDRAGLFVWHCHLLSHEDNEMMRPYRVGPEPDAVAAP